MLTVRLTCTSCGQEFNQSIDHMRKLFGAEANLPKRCPRCKDEEQERPDVTLDRKTIWSTDVVLDASVVELLVAKMEEFQAIRDDRPSHRLVIKGDRFGADWSGRIDIWSYVWPLVAGQIVHVAHQTVRKKVWVVTTTRRIGVMTLNPRTVEITRRVPRGTEKAEEREETNDYVVLLPSEAEVSEKTPILVWAKAYSKCTLKGFGRQFAARLEGNPIWHLGVSGGVRSGRAHTTAWLAVVHRDDPIRVVMTGDIAGTDHYPVKEVANGPSPVVVE